MRGSKKMGFAEDLSKALKAVEDTDVASKLETEIRQLAGKSFVKKEQYNNKVVELNNLQGEYDTIKADYDAESEFKKLYEEEKKAHEKTRNNQTTEKQNQQKLDMLKKAMLDNNANEDAVDLIIDKFDATTIEVEGNKIKNYDDLIKPYADKKVIFGEQKQEGAKLADPPKGGGKQEKYTMEKLKTMTAEQIAGDFANIAKAGELKE